MGALVILLDATGEYRSNRVSCPDCSTRTPSNGTVEYYHQLLAAVIAHPDQKTVRPLTPEPIVKQHNASKKDCELNAAKRLLPKIRVLYPKRKILMAADGRYAKGPFIKPLNELKLDYIWVARDGDQTHLVNEYAKRYAAGKTEQYTETEPSVKRDFCWTNGWSLNATHPDLKVNLLKFSEIKLNKEKLSTLTWITTLNLTRHTVFPIMRVGRCRWKVENETFNTLKNQGDNLEHSSGHGQPHLARVRGLLMRLRFLIFQIQETSCPWFQAARHRFHSRTSLWEK